ncbi:TBC1 domain family member 7 [Pseudolycoriella hygida]|uniref:TBC1 domain family member 7 n=1 Tax=Pseudolycoriella hygida TaxID=35572 RepID=A0A9Q0MUD7_9DIPT|nr:TBC1 domain family member 7 [Pseudolycoriella hygida]
MATDERNFRSTYYEKVGCRSVEEKRSLEILLKEKPLNRTKLKQFCLRFTVPSVHRALLWNLLLGLAPVFCDSHDYVMAQWSMVYEDLLRALKVLRLIDDKTTKSRIFYAMWLLENRKLKAGVNINVENTFVDITEVLNGSSISENDVDLYWIAKGFYNITREISHDFLKMKELTYVLLEKEDHAMFKHLTSLDIFHTLPMEKWYSSCFAGVLPKLSLIRIWDKICGKSKKIIVFVFIVLFNTQRVKLFRFKTVKEVLDHIDTIKENQEKGDLIVTKSIELWQQNRSHRSQND